MPKKLIEKVALLPIEDRKVLFVREKGQILFYNLGGRREEGEDDLQVLARELPEELSVELDRASASYIDTVEAEAAGDPDTVIRIHCYAGRYSGEPVPSSEIEEMGWFTSFDGDRTTPAGREILNLLVTLELID